MYNKPTLSKHGSLKNVTFSKHCNHSFHLVDSTVTIDGVTRKDKVNVCKNCGMTYWNL